MGRGGMEMKKVFALLGGDNRQQQVADLLRRDGHTVSLWGLGEENTPLAEAVRADCVVLPLPVSRDGGHLFAPLSRQTPPLEELWPRLTEGQLVCGGNVNEPVRSAAGRHGVEIADYFAREEVQIANAVPTAEGAIALAMKQRDRTLHRSRCLVIGYGRIGKVLAQRLDAMGAQVTVSARKRSDLAWIRAFGYHAAETGRLAEILTQVDVVFNTVPALVLNGDLLGRLPGDSLVIDLASEPGGVDFDAAMERGCQAIWARGLPGQVAPATAGEVIRDAIYHILEERGDPN